jgi:hypothetical protein
MKQMTKTKGRPMLIRWITVWIIIILGLTGLPSLNSSAQDPAPTATTEVPPGTASPTAGVPVGPTPGGPTATPEGRVVNFRTDKDEIDLGECVLLTWVARGDLAYVEFNEVDDDEDPILVEDQGERTECPDNDTDYELIVTWLDNSKSRSGIEIEVNGSGNGGDGSGSSGGGGGPVPTPGAFVVVTPIAYADVQAEVTPIPGFFNGAGSGSITSDDILATIKELPETGLQPASSTHPARQLQKADHQAAITALQAQWQRPRPPSMGELMLGLGALVVGLTALAGFGRQSP